MSWIVAGAAAVGAILGGTGAVGNKGGWGDAFKGGLIGGSLGKAGAAGFGGGGAAAGGGAAGGGSGGLFGSFGGILGQGGASSGAGGSTVSGAGVPWQLGNITKVYGGGSAASGSASGLGSAGNVANVSKILGMLGGGQGSQGGGNQSIGFTQIHSNPVPTPVNQPAATQSLATHPSMTFEQWAQQNYGPNWRGMYPEAQLKSAYEQMTRNQSQFA